MILKRLKKKLFPIAKFAFDKYYAKERTYKYESIEVLISPEVFPPHFTISTKLFLDYIKPLDLKGKHLLELGCGSGIIALFAASKGAHVTATDINPVALDMLKKNAAQNNSLVQIINSNLFDNLKNLAFDSIVINPPYYPKTPQNYKEQAWYCGENFEYFEQLFSQLPKHLAKETWMILSEDCDIKHIERIALKNGLSFTLILEKNIAKENNYIFSIQNTST